MHMINIRRAFAGIGTGLIALICATTPTAQATTTHPGDCARVTKTTQPLCRAVQAQRAYGYTDDAGNPQNWVTNGRALVHDITHQGYTQSEMADALTAAHRDYRHYVTAVTFNVDSITRTCGHHHGAGEVQEITNPADGHPYTWRHIVCD